MEEEVRVPEGMKRIFLLPGEMGVSQEPVLMATLLGSCVSVCVYNRHQGCAGMNHFTHNRSLTVQKHGGKYGDTSTKYLIQTLLAFDNNLAHLEAKIFGGGEVVANLGFGGGIGADNTLMARRILKEFNIPIVQEDVGGKQGRKIYFETKDFTVQVRLINARHEDYTNRKIRVMIVDDSEIVRKILRKDIESSQEFEVCAEAANAFDARDKLLETNPDVISLDIIMPGMDGLEFLEKMKQFKPKPVVIVSTIAKAGSNIEQRAKQLGAVEIIDKETLRLYHGPHEIRRKYLAALKSASMHFVGGGHNLDSRTKL